MIEMDNTVYIDLTAYWDSFSLPANKVNSQTLAV